MIVKNKKTGKDVTGFYLQLLKGDITNREFEKLANLKEQKQL